MGADRLFTDLRGNFRRGDIVTRLLYINIGVYLLVAVVGLVMTLFRLPWSSYVGYLELPAWPERFLRQPWSLLTYMFMHAGLLHLVFNMLWLFWFGRLFLMFFSSKHLRGLYLLGGICGGLLYMLAYNVFPYFEDAVYRSSLVGASASVLAIVFAVGIGQPDYEVQFVLIGRVKMRYVALGVLVLDLLLMTSDNAGGHIAHIGGALSGWWFAASIQRGRDITAWINRILDAVTGGSGRRQARRPKMKVKQGGGTGKKADAQQSKGPDMDRILDKLRKSGYGSLTEDEKKSLFDGGNS